MIGGFRREADCSLVCLKEEWGRDLQNSTCCHFHVQFCAFAIFLMCTAQKNAKDDLL